MSLWNLMQNTYNMQWEMSKAKEIALLSTATASLIALYWLGRYLLFGEVPIVTSVPTSWSSEWPPIKYVLPFAMSRWWDILIGPIWSVFVIFVLNLRDNDEDAFGLFAGLFVGFVSVFCYGSYETDNGFFYAVLVGLIIGIILLSATSMPKLNLAISYSIGFALFLGLGFGLIIGLTAFGLIFSIKAGILFFEKIRNFLRKE